MRGVFPTLFAKTYRRNFSMKTTKFQRITAFVLVLTFLLGGTVMTGAEDSSTTGVTTSDIKELLNAISYSEYIKANANVPAGTTELVFSATDNCTFVTSAGVSSTPTTVPDGEEPNENTAYIGEWDGVKGLYTPSTGVVTWEFDGIEAATRYSVVIECFPVENKSASIERILKINNKVPFAEARYLTIAKIWKNVYDDGRFELPKGENADDYLTKAAAMGISARTVTETVKGKEVTYIVYTMPEYWTTDVSALVDDQTVRFFKTDVDKNEIRASLVQAPSWYEYTLKDSNGYTLEPFQVVFEKDPKTGKLTFSLESVNEPLVISNIRLVPAADVEVESYADYLAKYEGVPSGKDKIKIEAEYYSAASSQTIYPVSDTTSAINSPTATDRTVLNVIGGDKWQTSGQWIEYKFKPSTSGMYNIATRFKQSTLEGMYTSRALYIYSDGTLDASHKGYYNGIPFEEAGRLQFNYSSDWQSGKLTDGDGTFDIYFEAGVVYTLRFEVTLGNMGAIINRVQKSLDIINDAYLNILKLTGANPDDYRDYGFSRIMPQTMIDMVLQSRELYAVSELLASEADEKSSMTATLDKAARLLNIMGTEDSNVAKNLDQLKSYIGSLGTWVGDAKTQPLTLDFIVIQGSDNDELPEAKAGFFKALWFEISSFIQSFFRNYDRMGAMTEINEDDSVEVWLAYGRDQAQVIRGLINNDFTPNTGIAIDLKLVAASTLLPSILSGMGPDVYIGVAQGNVINYAIRGALIQIEDLDGFEEATKDFNEAAMLVLGIEDAKNEMHYYGLPETQNFTMMFIREDIFAELDLEIPKTWDDVKSIIPILQANNMQIGMTKDENVFLYQLGGELFADNGMRINLDSNVALEAFNTMCEMFTMYSFPYKYDFPNRFRTGEMPIGFAAYTDTYNKLKVFATEIEGLWSFYPLPGYMDDEGKINNSSVSTITAICLINGCEDVDGAWEFSKWHSGAQCQIDYSNEMVAILGPSAKHATANTAALRSLPWTAAEYEQLQLQFNNLAAIPNYPGRYIVERYTQFAFLAAYDDNMDPVTEMQKYITTINVEITRKRQEFGLETLENGQTLAQKRMAEAEAALKAAHDSSSYNSSYDDAYYNILTLIEDYITEDYKSLRALADDLEALNAELFATAIKKMREAANSLVEYEAYK